MEIEPQTLTNCEVRADGTVVLGFTDTNGAPVEIRLSLNQIGALAMTLPDLISKALRSRYGDHSMRYAYPLASWTVEQSASDPQIRMVTLCTTDGFSVCFSMQHEMQCKLGEALASEGSASSDSRTAQIFAN